MSDLKTDIILGLIFITGLLGFMSGEYIVSTVLFASAAIFSNIHVTRRLTRK